MVRRVILASILAAIVSTSAAGAAMPGQITSEGGFVDVELPINSFQLDKDGAIQLSTSGIIDGRRIGFGLYIGPKWKVQKPDNVPITIHWGGAAIRSTGEESDAFLSLLAEKYGNGSSALRMGREVSVTTAMLEGAPASMDKKPLKMKVFFEHGGEDKYAEIFINVDMKKMKLEFRDKDPEYHPGILASLKSGQ